MYHPSEIETIYQDSPCSDEQPSHQSGDLLIGAAIWVPILAMVAPLFLLGYAKMGLIIAGIAVVLHSMLRPRIAVYILIMMVPAEWMVSVFPGVTTITKLIGLLALIVSVPRIITAIFVKQWDPATKWMLLMILWGAASLFWSIYPLLGIFFLQTLILVWGMPLLFCIQLNKPQFLRTALLLFVLSCLLSSFLYIVNSDIYAIKTTAYIRSSAGAFVGEGEDLAAEANVLSRCFAVGIFGSMFFIITSKGAVKKAFYVVVIMFLAIGIVISKTRAAYLFTPLALITGVLLLKGGGLSKRALLIIIIGFLGGLAAFAISKLGLAESGIQQRFTSIFEEGVGAGSRIEYWKAHLQYFINTGFRGVGLCQSVISIGHVAHNDVISIMGDLGIVGLAGFFGLHLCLFKRILKISNQWTKMFCLTSWLFIIFAGFVQNDYYRKYYGAALGFIFCWLHLDEAERLKAGEYLANEI